MCPYPLAAYPLCVVCLIVSLVAQCCQLLKSPPVCKEAEAFGVQGIAAKVWQGPETPCPTARLAP